MTDDFRSDQTPLLAETEAAGNPTDEGPAQAGPSLEKPEAKAAQKYDHLDSRVIPWLEEPAHMRIARINSDRCVMYPELQHLINEIHWLVLEPKRSRARGLVISGPPGSGKTTVAKLIERTYPIVKPGPDGVVRPKALCISISGARTTNAVLNRILAATHAPVASRHTIDKREGVVIDVLRRMNLRLLIIDEAQDVLGASASEQMRVLEVIKHLMNEVGVAVLALGTDRAREAFRADPHLAARFVALRLKQWQESDAFGQFLTAFERVLPLKKRSDLARPGVQKLLIQESGGVLDQMLSLIRRAATHAVVSGDERITLEALKNAPRPSYTVLSGAE